MSSSSGTTSAASSPSSRRRALAPLGHLLFRTRNGLFPIVLLTVAFGTRPALAGGDVARDHLVDALGVLVALAGQALRVLVIGLEYITRGGRGQRVWAATLVAGGIFAHCRNPLYLANMLVILGLALVHNGWAMYLVSVPVFAFFYVAIVSAEEEFLDAKFGEDYRSYCRRVPRWLPSIAGLARTLQKGSLDWLKVLRKEYGTPFGWLSGVLVLLVWEHRSAMAPPIGGAELRAIVVLWAVLAVLYSIVRTLKLRGRLGTD